MPFTKNAASTNIKCLYYKTSTNSFTNEGCNICIKGATPTPMALASTIGVVGDSITVPCCCTHMSTFTAGSEPVIIACSPINY